MQTEEILELKEKAMPTKVSYEDAVKKITKLQEQLEIKHEENLALQDKIYQLGTSLMERTSFPISPPKNLENEQET